jgi:hypothetical protein
MNEPIRACITGNWVSNLPYDDGYYCEERDGHDGPHTAVDRWIEWTDEQGRPPSEDERELLG